MRLTHVKHIRFIAWKLPGKHEILGLVYLLYSFRKQSKAPPGKNLNPISSSQRAVSTALQHGKPQAPVVCRCMLRESIPQTSKGKSQIWKKKKVSSKELPFRFPREWSDFPKNSLPPGDASCVNSLLHQRGTSETSKSAQNSVSYIIIFVFFYFSFSQAIYVALIPSREPITAFPGGLERPFFMQNIFFL